jgi:hypothetical protein
MIACVSSLAILTLAGQSIALPGRQQQQQGDQHAQNASSIASILNNATELSIFNQQIAKFPDLQALIAGNVSQYDGRPVPSIAVVAPTNDAWSVLLLIYYLFNRNALPASLRTFLLTAPPYNETQLQQRRLRAQQGNQNRTAADFRTPTTVLESVLLYQIINGTFNLTAMSSMNTTAPTLLAPFNVHHFICD